MGKGRTRPGPGKGEQRAGEQKEKYRNIDNQENASRYVYFFRRHPYSIEYTEPFYLYVGVDYAEKS